MNTLGSLPWVCQLFICACADVTSDQRIHSFSCNFSRGLSSACDLCNLGVKHTLLIRIDFEGSQDVDFLDQKWWSILLS